MIFGASSPLYSAISLKYLTDTVGIYFHYMYMYSLTTGVLKYRQNDRYIFPTPSMKLSYMTVPDHEEVSLLLVLLVLLAGAGNLVNLI